MESAGTGPLREMRGDSIRRQLIVVELRSLEVFERLFDDSENQNIHDVRENSTTDCSWTLYDTWVVKTSW